MPRVEEAGRLLYGGSTQEDATYRRGRERLTEAMQEDFRRRIQQIDDDLRESVHAVDQKAQTANNSLEGLLTARCQSMAELTSVQFAASSVAIERARDAMQTRIQDVLERLTMRHEQIASQTASASTQLDKRLEAMNQARDALKDQAGQMVTRHEMQSIIAGCADSQRKLEERLSVTMSRTEITSALTPLGENLRKVEDRLSSSVTRSDLTALIEPLSDAVRRLENKGSNLDGRFWALAILPIIISLMVTLGITGYHPTAAAPPPPTVLLERAPMQQTQTLPLAPAK